MGQKVTRLAVVKKRHKKCWKNYKKEIDDMVVSQTQIFHCAVDRTLQCPINKTLSSFNSSVKLWTENTGFSLTVQKKIIKVISQIASSNFKQPRNMSRKEVEHNFKTKAFKDGDKELVVFLLLSHNVTNKNDKCELGISLTLSIYQDSPRHLLWPSTVSLDSAIELSDC